MKTLFATLAAATAVAAIAAPAAAQSYDRDGRHDRDGRYEQRNDRDGRHDNRGAYNIDARQQQLNERITAGQRRGTIDRLEARQLWNVAREINGVEARYRVGGLNWNERADLDRRLDGLETRIARESRDRDYGQNHYGRR